MDIERTNLPSEKPSSPPPHHPTVRSHLFFSSKSNSLFFRLIVIVSTNNLMNSIRMIVFPKLSYFFILEFIKPMYWSLIDNLKQTSFYFQLIASKFKEYNLSVISLSTLNDAKAALNNLIQRIQKRFEVLWIDWNSSQFFRLVQVKYPLFELFYLEMMHLLIHSFNHMSNV